MHPRMANRGRDTISIGIIKSRQSCNGITPMLSGIRENLFVLIGRW
jgi:hypothetical protein